MVELKKISEIIEMSAPLASQEGWDNSGWQIHLGNPEINRILVTLEVNEEVVEEAVSENVQLIVSHHPLIFGGIKKVDTETCTGSMICRLIQHGINVYATHTPFDKCEGGNNDYLADLLELQDIHLKKVPED